MFSECVAKGSCFLSWGSGPGVVDCLRVVFVLQFSNRVVALSMDSMGKVRKGDVL